MYDLNDSTLEATIVAVLAQHACVKVGYLFGSACTGRRGPLSDIDVAVLLSASPSRRAMEGDVQDALCRALHTDRVDLISLADSPSPLSYRVIREGRCIHCSDRKMREAFESDTVMRYLDFKPIRDQAFGVSRNHILEHA
ncbi:MAG: nucleotidyltransferase domain-containing protein [Verrucomicrobia bacterium]|jgi:uncharacterized protein|nr:nucleotidyltransferase domain-containing protein [Verrucomicrobiota bacterium]